MRIVLTPRQQVDMDYEGKLADDEDYEEVDDYDGFLVDGDEDDIEEDDELDSA